MAWIIGVAVVAILLVIIVLFSLAIPRFKKVQKLVDKLNLVTRESLVGMLVIRAFSNQKVEEKRFDEINIDLRKTNHICKPYNVSNDAYDDVNYEYDNNTNSLGRFS